MTITVDANLFRIVYGAVSTEETRYYLNGVHVEPHPTKGALLVSTDGHRMIVAHDPEAVCDESAIIALPRNIRALCRRPKMFETKRLLVVDTKERGSATLQDVLPGQKKDGPPKIEPILTAHRVIIDGTFPDWKRVIPLTEEKTTAAANFDPKFMRDWGLVGMELGSIVGAVSSMRVFCHDAASPAVIRWERCNTVFGIQMPMRADAVTRIPDFMRALSPAEKQAA